MSRTNEKAVNVAVPADVHTRIKAEADRRGMSLRNYVRYMDAIAARATDDQRREAYAAFDSVPDDDPKPARRRSAKAA